MQKTDVLGLCWQHVWHCVGRRATHGNSHCPRGTERNADREQGGAFTDKLTWRWCFYINLPIGAVTLLFITVLYRPSSNARAQSLALGWKARLNQLDPIGLLILLPMIVCLLLALQLGGSQYDWGSGRIIALLILFVVGFLIFVGVQFWQKDNATLPPRVLKQRSVAAGAWFSLMLGGSFYTFVYYL